MEKAVMQMRMEMNISEPINDNDDWSEKPNSSLKGNKTALLRQTVLIVDDQERVLKVLSRGLSKSFSNILTAQNAEDAERLLRQNNVDYLVCDLELSEGEPNGFHLVPKWREKFPNIRKAIIFTGVFGVEKNAPVQIDAVVDKSEGIEGILNALFK